VDICPFCFFCKDLAGTEAKASLPGPQVKHLLDPVRRDQHTDMVMSPSETRGIERDSSGCLEGGFAGSDPRLGPLKSQQLRMRHGMEFILSTERSSHANESIPNHRHRARTAPREQSIRFPSCNLICKRKRDWSVTFVSLLYYPDHRSR
jgi:hypothetical protein